MSKRKMTNLLVLLLALFFLAGCTPPSSLIVLNPNPVIEATPIGYNKPVILRVIDARGNSLENTYAHANITPTQNVVAIFTKEINKALIAYGFSPVTLPGTQQNQLTVKLLSLDYSVASGLFGANSETDVSADVEAKTASGTYRKTYYGHSYSDNYLSRQEDASAEVNAAVNKLLNNILNDKALMQFLAK